MKNLKLVALAFAIFASSFSFATTLEDNPNSELREQIVEFLNNAEIEIDTNELIAEVIFTLNKNGELIIIDVTTNNEKAENFVRTNLDHKKVGTALTSVEGKIYTLPIRIVKEG
jgi:lipopolysaccharide export LptBFGC system permease protein LptF